MWILAFFNQQNHKLDKLHPREYSQAESVETLSGSFCSFTLKQSKEVFHKKFNDSSRFFFAPIYAHSVEKKCLKNAE